MIYPVELNLTEEEKREREVLLQRAAEVCLQYKRQGFHCSESGIRACNDVLHLNLSEDAIRCAAGFMGGGGNYRDRCGILEAGCMAVSFLYGRVHPSQEIWRNNYLIRQLHERFQENLGSIYCRDILEREIALQNGEENREVCNNTFTCGARTVIELILDAEKLLETIPPEEKAIDHYE